MDAAIRKRIEKAVDEVKTEVLSLSKREYADEPSDRPSDQEMLVVLRNGQVTLCTAIRLLLTGL